MERSLYCYIGSLRKLSKTYTTTHTTKSCKENVSSLFNTAYSIITNKDDLRKENAEIKNVLKENGYQESIISKIFKRITTNNHSLPQAQRLTLATDIQEERIRQYKLSINLTYVEGTSEKLRRISRSHKIRSTFCTENTLRKLICKQIEQLQKIKTISFIKLQ